MRLLSLLLMKRGKFSKKNKIYNSLESKVPKYTLPDPLIFKDGSNVETKEDWSEKRRNEILNLFKTYVYGKSPEKPKNMTFELESEDKHALKDIAIQKQIKINLLGIENGPCINVLIYLPKNSPKPVPVFLGLNFFGNHAITSDPSVKLPTGWVQNKKKFHINNNKATEDSRGVRANRWPIDYILGHNYGLATAYYGDLTPDHKKGLQDGINKYFLKNEKNEREPDDWGAIGAWSWGLSRIMDYFETDPNIDKTKICVLGHSRLGKTALWAGAQDERFSIVISNNSGCGGAAISRRSFGETVYLINYIFPHWFCKNFRSFNNKENDLPVDQHMLISLIAPRPCYIASADRDLWADPLGEYLSGIHATPVYKLFGKEGLNGPEWPNIEEPIDSIIGHHIRRGKHDLTLYDWQQYIRFADKYLR